MMKTYKRCDDDYFAVFKDDSLWYRIGIFHIKEMFSDELEAKPYYIHKARFKTREQAEVVCEMISEEYNNGFNDGVGSCY